ncbi:acetamidase/formamidase family protein [Prauserella muralis]|uniref:Acetamidase n=1 Tax=Prauserella muralis TaxID=588067 RepID=A0A2V4B7E0_9PSEU|nr:acetamidase/formamidase family protein [Prauserella muralis]PXY31244.1 acetamidase [Prauserella muralis]TWE14451.1 acetamidase/formamidase [Prauserella muralis]
MTMPTWERRMLLRAAAGLAAAGAATLPAGTAAAGTGHRGPVVLQPHRGPARGHYLPARPETVTWGRLPNRDSTPATVVDSGSVITIDTISHEGVLEDQGRDPLAYFTGHGVPPSQVLTDAVEVAARVAHDGPGPHVVTGPVAVRGAEPGHTLKIEVLDLRLRVPYGVVSNRHGKGALPGEYPEAWAGRAEFAPYFNSGGNVSVFTEVGTRRGELVGVLPGGAARFPLAPFLGVMGVARDTSDLVNSVPPTDAGGNIDINDLGVGSTLYLPVRVPGALFFTGDPHMAQGDGEVALTAMEGSLRATFRLTAIPPGGPAPKLAFDEPFGETPSHWVPIGLSDPDGPVGGQVTSLDVAMRRAVRSALRFLTEERGMPEPVAYAYLSAATDFQVSQVVDITTGIHGLIRKTDFGR